MSTRDTRDVIMDPTATQLGFAWFKEPSGKVWWTLLTGRWASGGPMRGRNRRGGQG